MGKRRQNPAVAESVGTPMTVPEGGAVVRMYCTGLGDCFLIGLHDPDQETAFVLIDCGVWKGTPGAKEWLTRIVQHIKGTVGKRGLDVLVATHQHWDHLSGFAQAKDVFDQIPVKEVWLPWTEDESDPLALRLANERRLAVRAALAASLRLRAVADNADAAGDEQEAERIRTQAETIDHLLKFVGRTPPDDEGARAEDAQLVAAGLQRGASAPGAAESDLGLDELAAGPSTEDLLNLVRERVARPRYLRPSASPVAKHPFHGVRIYALGPPTDLKLLGKDNPSKDPGKSEIYLSPAAAGGMPLNEDAALHAAAYRPRSGHRLDDEQRQRHELMYPFERYDRIPLAQAAEHSEHGAFFREIYGFARTDPAPEWRRIDSDWLEAADQLALNLDDHVNNTSLVLAFELGEGEDAPVLLFPGDAQVGNWLSWHLLDGDGALARGLLGRTVLYKVGHHASHNATLKDKGLKLMTNTAQLVVMIPVDQVEAHKPKGKKQDGWDMPYGKLLTDLHARTEGRVMRADTGVELLEKGKPAGWSESKWKQFTKDTLVETAQITIQDQEVTRPFFIQYTVRG